MQADGNLVWYYGQRVVWAANPGKSDDPECVMQKDGNLVIYGNRNGKRQAVWDSGTWKFPGSHLALQSDGNLVIYYNGPPVLVRVLANSIEVVHVPKGGKVAVWSLDRLGKRLPPARGEDTVAVSIHYVRCERRTPNEGAVFGEPADEVYFLAKEGSSQRRVGSEDGRDIVEFKNGTAKWLCDDLAQVVLRSGERKQLAVSVNEQEGKIRVSEFFISFSGGGVETFKVGMDLDPDDDHLGTFLIDLRNDGGMIRASFVPGEHAVYNNGVVRCNGAGAIYHIALVVDHYAHKTLRPIPLE